MPLNADAVRLIRANLDEAAQGRKPRIVSIGTLTESQLLQINEHRRNRGLNEITGEVVFCGRHVYDSRVSKDGYTVEDVINQIVSAMSADSRLKISPKMTVIENPMARDDGYGSKVNDQAVLECTCRYPKPELYSVIPRGDKKPSDR